MQAAMRNGFAGGITIASLILANCVSIPDHVIQQNQQRRQLLSKCSAALNTIEGATNPPEVSLSTCDEHRALAVRMLDDLNSRAQHDRIDPIEWDLAGQMVADVGTVRIRACYANVKRGREVKDAQGRVGIAACDRLAEEKRHRDTMEAIEKARQDAIGAALIMNPKR